MKRLVQLLSFSAVLLTASFILAAEPLKIGALFSVTGPPSFLGEPERNTAQMVVDEINKAGGIKGRPLELIVYDTTGDATKAVQWANKLIKDDKVVAIIGPSIRPRSPRGRERGLPVDRRARSRDTARSSVRALTDNFSLTVNSVASAVTGACLRAGPAPR